jgi:hypothetical protein
MAASGRLKPVALDDVTLNLRGIYNDELVLHVSLPVRVSDLAVIVSCCSA